MHPSGHRRLARPVSVLPAHCEHVVVGSGYGASVAALRLAAAGHEVAILERGREWMPGDFPEELGDLVLELRSALNPLGLVEHNRDIRADVDVICASGLGGTSLINAAIALRPPRHVFELPEWPRALRADAACGALERDYARAEMMLRPTTSPLTRGIPRARLHAERFAADLRGVPTGELPLMVNHERGWVDHGVTQAECIGCGNCCGGCNVGAKRTLTTHYLPAAADRGAAIFTGVEVTYLERLVGGQGPRWRLHLRLHEPGRPGLLSRSASISAGTVWLGAGSLGTTRILVRAAREGLPLSRRLGERFSTNGDVLGAAYNCEAASGALPFANPRVAGESRVGQTITVYADFRARGRPLHEQFVLLDGVIPRPFAPHAARLLALHPLAVAGATRSSEAFARLARDATSLGYPSADGALGHTSILLACGHDSASGRYAGSDDDLYVSWPDVASEASFAAIYREMEAFARHARGTFLENPRSALGGVMQATHPLGGAPMGETVEDGVVDHRGAVFDSGGEPHAGLYVVDAAAIPRSLSAPPLLTITALAERAMRLFLGSAAPDVAGATAARGEVTSPWPRPW